MTDVSSARFPCPCCGHLTLHDQPGSYDICHVCFWEEDGVQLRWPDYAGGANRPSLIDSQANFVRYGAMEERFTGNVRPPAPDEPLDEGWRPVDAEADNFEARGVQETPWPDDLTTLYWWRPTFWRRALPAAGTPEVRFVRTADGAPYLDLGTAWSGVSEALNDTVGSLPPRGSAEQTVSTYWIDRALEQVRQMITSGRSGPFQGGNAATLSLVDGQVEASSDYELFDSTQLPIATFEAILLAWRAEVVRVRDTEAPPIPETYRRAPYPADGTPR